ncbi:MAG: hypothetical protein IPM69_18330 [Ignavibacteria bacterium]|nr:hypothetical protein [Ignavibacteria bacterium]
METPSKDTVEYHQDNVPILLFVEGIILIILTGYCIGYLMMAFSFDLPNWLLYGMFVYTSVTLFNIFRRIVTSVIFDRENDEIRITYYHYFFRKHTVVVKYANAGFLAFNHVTPLVPRNSSNGLTEVRFYSDRKYIARVVISRRGWKSEQLVEMVEMLTGFAHEFQLSPRLL